MRGKRIPSDIVSLLEDATAILFLKPLTEKEKKPNIEIMKNKG